jgi:hypothetical protein
MKKTLLVLLSVAGAVGLASVQAQLINVDFNQNSGPSWGGGGPNPGPTMTGTAVLGSSASDQWNGITVNSSATPIALNYANGSASPASMTFSSGGGYDVFSYGGTTAFLGNQWQSLMEDYIYGDSIVTLTGLTPNQAYEFVAYSQGDVNAGKQGAIASFGLNGNSQTLTKDINAGTLIVGTTYVQWGSVAADGSGTLTLVMSGAAGAERDLNGFQLQAIPEPSTLGLVSAGAALLLGYQRRKAFRA